MKSAVKTVIVVLAGALLTACGGAYVPSTPRYAVRAGEQPTPPPPQYPTAEQAGGPTQAEAVLPPAPSTDVEAAELPPLAPANAGAPPEPLPPVTSPPNPPPPPR